MKKRFLLIIGLFLLFSIVKASYFEKLPYTIKQPNGMLISCFISGDEFFNWIHDEEGYTIIQAANGYYYYAIVDRDVLKPSEYLVNSVDPSRLGIKKWAKISPKKYQNIRNEMFRYENENNAGSNRAPHSGILNNIVVYIRFSDEAEFSTTRQDYDNKFNPLTGISLKSYYKEVSYNNLTINSTHYPVCAFTSNLSFQDIHPRSYFQPYNATTNPNGYSGGASGNERTTREHQLLTDAINWININSPVSPTLNIDGDNDNKVDNVCFIIKGNSDGWNELLWAHRWALFSQYVYINGKRVYDYTFQPEGQVAVQTICHEMFHALGAPDLYHYNDGGLHISPVGNWDLMESGGGHMSAYMKWKYSNHTWISTIPEITTSGTYTLNPLSSSSNNCFKIASPYSTDEYFIVEYRNKTGTYEINIPGSGLLVYRIDSRINTGNRNGPPDEVYIYRPGGTVSLNGNFNNAFYSSTVGRTAINDTTNPSCFLQNGSLGGLNISNVSTAGSNISFKVTFPLPCAQPTSQATIFSATAINDTTMTVGFIRGNGDSVIVIAKADNPVSIAPITGYSYFANAAFGMGTQIGNGNYVVYKGIGNTVNLTNLTPGTNYHFAIFEFNGLSNCYKIPALTAIANTTGYCTAGATTALSYGEYISNITIGSINQTSIRGNSGYQNFTSLITTMQIGTNYSVSISCTNSYSSDQILVWIDWNHDGDFIDPGENVYTSSGAFLSPHITANFSPPIGAFIGTTRMRIRLDDSDNGPHPYPCANAEWGEVEDYSISIIPKNSTFTAAVSNAWEINENWDHGIPDSSTNVIIAANKLAIVNSNNNYSNNLNIAPTGKLTINASKDLFIKGKLTIESDDNGTGSLIVNGTLFSDSNFVRRYIPVTVQGEFHQLSAPVTAQSINAEFNPTTENFYTWKESNSSWLAFEDTGFSLLNGSNNFLPGRGYAVSYPATSTKTFTGNLNNGSINTSLTLSSGNYAGWNFIGNPYPSAINWNTASGFTRNMLEKTVSNQYTFWIWNPEIGNYGCYISNDISGINGVSNFIPTSQGFWVKTASASTFSINNTAKEHATQTWLKSSSSDINTLRLKVSTSENNFSDEMMLRFGYSNDSDGADKMFSINNASPSIYSKILNRRRSINLLSSINNNTTFPIGFKAGVDGNYIISAMGVESFGSVILEDLITGIQQNLSSNNNYSFNALKSDNENRFLLYLTPSVISKNANTNPTITYSHQTINITNPWYGKTTLIIYDITGRLIHSFNLDKRNETFSFSYKEGVYIFKMINPYHLYILKKVIN